MCVKEADFYMETFTRLRASVKASSKNPFLECAFVRGGATARGQMSPESQLRRPGSGALGSPGTGSQPQLRSANAVTEAEWFRDEAPVPRESCRDRGTRPVVRSAARSPQPAASLPLLRRSSSGREPPANRVFNPHIPVPSESSGARAVPCVPTGSVPTGAVRGSLGLRCGCCTSFPGPPGSAWPTV